MENDYQMLAKEALALAKSLAEDNRRLKLSIALMNYRSAGKKRGRKEIYTRDDIKKFFEIYTIAKTKMGGKLTQKKFLSELLKITKHGIPEYRLKSELQTLQNKFSALKKEFEIL